MNDQLFQAAESGNVYRVESLLEKEPSIGHQVRHGTTALHQAAAGGHDAIVRLLLAHGAYINYQNTHRDTALHEAAVYGHEDIVRLLLESGAPIDYSNEYGHTPLYEAVDGGHEAIVKLLIAKGADINYQAEGNDSTALHAAVAIGHEAIVRILLESGADINYQNTHGNTLLHEAAACGHEAIVKLLIAYGAPINHQAQDGATALHEAAAYGHEAIVKLLIAYGAPIDYSSEYGHTVLYKAISGGHEAIVKILLESGAAINYSNKYKMTALRTAVTRGHTDIIKLLLKHGAYAYHHQDDDSSLDRYWENLKDADKSQLPLYTHLLLGGVSIPEGVDLPEWLATRKELIDTTISGWLAPLKLSPTVSLIKAKALAKAEYSPIIPSILRALPRLLKWMEVVHNTIKTNQADTDANQAKTPRQALIKRLLVTTDGDETLPDEDRQLKTTLLDRLEGRLPEELLVSIREVIIQQALVTELRTYYRKIPPRVANYLVAEVMANTKGCFDFHRTLFQGLWETPLEPPITNTKGLRF